MNQYEYLVLNDAIKTLIDSCEGYQTCCDLVGEANSMWIVFRRRLETRLALIREIQTAVEQSGGQPADSVSLAGALHRNFALFTTIFRCNDRSAFAVLQYGENFLAQKLGERLEDKGLSASTQLLLRKALNLIRAEEPAVQGQGEHLCRV